MSIRRLAFKAGSLGTILCAVATASLARADGPGLGNLTWAESEVWKPIGRIDGSIGAPRAHGTLHMHRGWLAVVFAPDSGKGLGGWAFYDMSDPRAPKLVARKDDEDTKPIREAHGWGFWGDLAFLQTIRGFTVWDWSDPTNPKKVSDAVLPGIQESDYGTGSWWLAVQAPYVYVGGTGNGVYVVDVSDPKNPKLADRGGKPNPIPGTQLGGFRVGPVFAVGNLLIVTAADEPGYTTLDIGDPVQPKILKTKRTGTPSAYSTIVNGGRLYAAGNDKKVHLFDLGNPAVMASLGETGTAGDDKGGYLQVQDGFAHVGFGTTYAKFDVRTKGAFSLVGQATSGIKGRDEDFANPMGNLVFIGDDHGKGTTIVPQQAAPDTTPPEVNWVVPRNGATKQPVTSRVGLTFSDAIDTRTLTSANVIVRKAGGAEVAGKLSYGLQILNFAPDAPLEVDATYEVVVPAGGVKDVAGNPVKGFTSSFSTGVGGPAGCTIAPPGPSTVGAKTTFAIEAPLAPGLTYSWDFGDGSEPTAPSSSPKASYAFAEPGHYTVAVAVSGKDAAGKDVETSCLLLQTVTHPLLPTAPTKSSTMAIDEARARVWVANPDAATVASIGLSSHAKELEVPVGKRPRTLAVAKDGTLWVTNEDDATISVLDGQSGAAVATIALPYASRPYGLAFAPDGASAYVALGAIGKLAKLDPQTRAVVATVDVGPWPRGVAVSGDGAKVLVTRFLSPFDWAEVTEVDAASFAKSTTYDLAFEKTLDNEANGRGVLNYLSSIAITPDGRRAFVPAKKDNIARGLAQDGLPLTFESTVRTVLAQIDLVEGVEDPLTRIDFNDRSLAFDVALTKLGDVAFVATQGTNTIEVVDALNGQLLTSIEKVGAAPQGLVLDPTGTKLFVQSFLSRDVTVWDVKGIVELTDVQFRKLATVTTVEREPLAPEVLLGKRIFYDASDERMSKDKYLACATCHLDGDHDGRAWDFTDRGEGMRNTTSLLGRRGTGHGRLHWSANFDEVQDFEHDIRGPFGGAGFLSEADWKARGETLGQEKAGASPELDALAAYVASLSEIPASPHRNADGTLGDDALDGLALFRSLGCETCHAGPDLTDSATGVLHDVGSIKETSGKRLGEPLVGLDTPTLRGVWATAPYLHDGSAATLEEVFTIQDPQAKHAGRALSPDELRKLVAYLMQIDAHDDSGVDPAARRRDDGCGCRWVGAGSTMAGGAALPATAVAVTLVTALFARLGARLGCGRRRKRAS